MKLDIAINFRRDGRSNVHEEDHEIREPNRDPEIPYLQVSGERGEKARGAEEADKGADGRSE